MDEKVLAVAGVGQGQMTGGALTAPVLARSEGTPLRDHADGNDFALRNLEQWLYNKEKEMKKKLFGGILVIGMLCIGTVLCFKYIPPETLQKVPLLGAWVVPDKAVDATNAGNTEPSPTDPQEPLDARAANHVPVPVKPKTGTMSSTQTAPGLSKTARIYSGMKPEEAVQILDNVEDDTVVELLRKMDEQQAAKILALMDSSRAAVLSRKLLLAKGKPMAAAAGTAQQGTTNAVSIP